MNAQDTIWLLSDAKEEAVVRSPEWYRELVEAVNALLEHDFNALVQMLYRLDVSEEKIRNALGEHAGTDAAELIAELLLERQLEKLKTREAFKTPRPKSDDDLAW